MKSFFMLFSLSVSDVWRKVGEVELMFPLSWGMKYMTWEAVTWLLSHELEFCFKCDFVFQSSISTVPFSTKCKCCLSGDHFSVVHLKWHMNELLAHLSLQEHSISSWSSSGCQCCRVHGVLYAFCILSVLSPWWGVAELFCTFSVWHLWGISGAQFNSELTDALGVL